MFDVAYQIPAGVKKIWLRNAEQEGLLDSNLCRLFLTKTLRAASFKFSRDRGLCPYIEWTPVVGPAAPLYYHASRW